MTVLIDTNMILDIFLKREPFFQAPYQAPRKAIEQDTGCYVSAAAVTDLLYLAAFLEIFSNYVYHFGKKYDIMSI